MASDSIYHQLSELEAARDSFSKGSGARILKLIRALDRAALSEPLALIRFHEALLFLRAFPQSAAVRRGVERVLNGFHKKVGALRGAGADMSEFDTYEYAGIAGTGMEDTLSFDVARWLVRRLPGKVEIAWDNYEPGRELGNTGPRFMPLLKDDAFVEADTPWREWLTCAASKRSKGGAGIPAWLVSRFEALPLAGERKAELYESLRVPLRWELENSPLTRTRNWRTPRKIFYHSGALITRSQISLGSELGRRPPGFTRLSQDEGEKVVEFIREVMLVRYRELYGTTLADGRSVVRVDLGTSAGTRAGKNERDESRGVEIYLWNLAPERRLPLRAYVAGFTLKNGVPINYIEAIGLCEWMEVGFNTFYTFRGGEAGWIYAQVLRALCAYMGTTVVSVYPYQLGHENDEAIESGAFWFYRKLGFRPGRRELLELVRREEKKIAADRELSADAAKKYRTPARILRRLAAGHVFYELPGAEVGAWDGFSTRRIGLRVNERMRRDFGGDLERMRGHSRRELEEALGIRTANWNSSERAAFDHFALVLAGSAGVRRWLRQEKDALVRLIRAKPKRDEMDYLHLTQQHERLRDALLALGSGE